ncbi:hypothetical protein [Thermoflexus sp.]|uniref:hypothetical protein n=1 Tax=Thermoflexus sp. TaxID=1969742 RepID=UPI0035E42DD6
MEREAIFQLLLDQVRQDFDFLRIHGFTGPYVQTWPSQDVIWFTGKHLAIEFHLDWHDQALDCYLVRLVEGKKPGGGYMDEEGKRIRLRLDSWLMSRVIQEPLSTLAKRAKRKKPTWGTQRLREEIEKLKQYAVLLQERGHQILADNPQAFDQIEEELKERGE